MKIKPKRTIYIFLGKITPKHYIFSNPELLPNGKHNFFNAMCLEEFLNRENPNIRKTGYNKEHYYEITHCIHTYIPSNRLEEFYKVFDSLSDVEE